MVLMSIKKLFLILLITSVKYINASENLNQNSVKLKSGFQNLTITENRNFKENLRSDVDDNNDILKLKNVTPLKNMFLGVYKNYKSTYLGNRTASMYRKLLNRRLIKSVLKTTLQPNTSTTIENITFSDSSKTINKDKRRKRKKQKLTRNNRDSLIYSFNGEYRYNVGPGVNVSLDMERNIVGVNLDENCLKDVLLGFGNWDDSDEGRGKKYDMLSKILPLFILPFLIQSAVIPFLVTKLKLLLIKSILVGKLAIFLLVVTAIKNNQKTNTYEVPSYWASDPMRRSEIFTNSGGYRVEGRPANLIQ